MEFLTNDCVNMECVLRVEGLYAGYRGEDVLKGVTLSLNAREFVGILGPNGSGKTTLCRVMTGVLAPNKGRVLLFGEDIKNMSAINIARKVAVIPQRTLIEFPILGLDVVLMGRYPMRTKGFFRTYAKEDYDLAFQSMTMLEAQHLAHRQANGLSGGEAALLSICRAFCQSTPILLADEATANLDPWRKLHVFELLTKINKDNGVTIITVMHDINLAALFCERLIFMKNGAVVLEGRVEEVLTKENLRDVYGVDVEIVSHPRRGRPQVLMG